MSEEKKIAYETIERYLSGEMVGNELKEFKEKFASNPELEAQVELHKQLQEAISTESGELNFRQLLKKEGANYQAEKKQKRIVQGKFRRFWLAVAALFIFNNNCLVDTWIFTRRRPFERSLIYSKF